MKIDGRAKDILMEKVAKAENRLKKKEEKYQSKKKEDDIDSLLSIDGQEFDV